MLGPSTAAPLFNAPERVAARELILQAFQQERYRTELLFGLSCVAGPNITDLERLMVLTEELGEVAQAVRAHLFPDARHRGNLNEEVIQLGAACLAWLEARSVTEEALLAQKQAEAAARVAGEVLPSASMLREIELTEEEFRALYTNHLAPEEK